MSKRTVNDKRPNVNINIIETIGLPAFLEQMAEEASELSQASLKFARKLRGENPTPKEGNELVSNLCEEVADVATCMDVLARYDSEFIKHALDIEYAKRYRWIKRLEDAKNDKGCK